ncbi:PHR1, partial [Symbiodinium sp. KB8]
MLDGAARASLPDLALSARNLVRSGRAGGDDARMVAVLESMGEVSVTVSAMRETKAGVVLTRLVDAHGEATVRRAAAQARAKLAAQLKERVGAVNARLRTRTILQALPNAESDGNLSTRDRLIKHLSAPPPRLPCVVAVTSFEYDNAAKFDGSRRTRMRKSVEGANSGPVIYWMSRDQRIRDNWALVSAQRQAYKHKAPLVVVFTVSQDFGGASARQAGFQLRGLRFLEADLSTLGIGFRLLVGSNPAEELARYAAAVEARHVVTDFSPLRQAQAWRDDAERRLHDGCGLEYVDAHNVVPCWLASDKPEVCGQSGVASKARYRALPPPWGATRTFRPKLHARIHHFLTVFPAVLSHSPFPFNDAAVVGPSEGPLIAGPAPINAATGLTDWGAVAAFLKINWALPEVTWAQPGERAAEAALAAFLESARRVDKYDTEADDPNKPEVRSMLSAHIRYGHLSAQRCCLELVRVAGGAIKDVFVSRAANGMQAWAEEILVRRELSDNFCFFEERVSSP